MTDETNDDVHRIFTMSNVKPSTGTVRVIRQATYVAIGLHSPLPGQTLKSRFDMNDRSIQIKMSSSTTTYARGHSSMTPCLNRVLVSELFCQSNSHDVGTQRPKVQQAVPTR